MRRGRGTGVSLVAVVLTVGWLAAACSSTPAEQAGTGGGPAPSGDAATGPPDREAPTVGAPRPGGSLIVGLAAETDSFNPYSGQWSSSSYLAANAFFDPLMAVDEKGIAKPYLAESIAATGDFRSWTITLRPGVTFHDGTELDAAALKKHLDAARTSGLTSQAFTPVQSVDVDGPLAVKVTMSKPWATFPATLSMQSGYVAAPAMIDDPAGANAKPIGTGPFVFVERVRDASLKTKKNPGYWRKDAEGTPLPYLDAVEFRILADASSRGNALAAGDINAMDVLTPDSYRQQADAARRDAVQMITNTGSETDETVIAMNTTKEPFDDLLARQALQAAVDQDKISAQAYQSAFPGTWGMFEKGSPYYISREEAGYPAPDLTRAKDLVARYEQQHGKKLEFTVLIPPDPQYLAIAQAVQAEVKEAGITANLQAIEQTQLIRNVVVTGDYQAAGFLLRGAPSPDQSYIFLATKANATGISLNFTRHDDPEVTAAMDDFRAAGDPQQRVEAIATVQRRLAAEVPMVFLVNNRVGFVASNVVHGLRATTFPGTEVPAAAPYPVTPFFTSAWKDQATG